MALTHDAQRLEKLVKIAKPVALPELKMAGTNSSGTKKNSNFGRPIRQFSHDAVLPMVF